MQFQNIRFFVAIAELKHFGAAAAMCGVTQPTLSAGLRTLEQELGKRLVERDRRFVGLTEHGVAILPWAQQALGSLRGLKQAADGSVAVGAFRLAVIPAALPLVGQFGKRLLRDNPGLTLDVRMSTSRDIERELAANTIDAGITYLDHEPISGVNAVPLHQEDYVVAVRADGPLGKRAQIGWADIAEQKLCLLHKGMQFHRILAAEFAERGLPLHAAAVADNYTALLSLVYSGDFISILPGAYADMFSGLDWCRFLHFDDAAPPRRIGLVIVNRNPMAPSAEAAFHAAQAISSETPDD